MGALEATGCVRRTIASSLAATLALALAALAGPTAQIGAAGDQASFTVAASGDDCPEDKVLCYRVENASSGLRAGEEVTIRFENRDDVEHSLYVANGSRSDSEGRDTPADAALADTGEVPPGEVAAVNVTVPDGDAVYLWCDVGDHESEGMWTQIPVDAATEEASGPDQGSRRVPTVPGGALVAALSGVAWLAAGRDRAIRLRGLGDGPETS